MDNTSFSSSLLILVLMIAALAALPWLLRRWQQRQQSLQSQSGVTSQVLSSVAVGQQQRVVTVEVGQGAQKTCLVLGVTPQSIQCLHVLGSQPAAAASGAAQGFANAMEQVQHLDANGVTTPRSQ